MIRRIFDMIGIDNQHLCLIWDAEGLWRRMSCDDAIRQEGFTVAHFLDDMQLRRYYEFDFASRAEEAKFALIIDAPDMYVPSDIRLAFHCVALTLDQLFPFLQADALRELPGADYDAIAFCARRFVLPSMDRAATLDFCQRRVLSGEYGAAYGQTLIEQAAHESVLSQSYKDWGRVAMLYGKAAMIVHSGVTLSDFDTKRGVMEQAFAQWIPNKYKMLSGSVDRKRPIMLSRVTDYIRRAAPKSALIVMDGMSFENFEVIRHALAGESLSFETTATFSFFPTVTAVARQSIFSGKLPLEHEKPFSLVNEEKQWRAFWQQAGLRDSEIAFMKGIPAEIPFHAKALGIVINIVDDLMHAELQGMAGMQQGLREWMRQGALCRLLHMLLDAGFSVFMTSDHGNTSAIAQGRFTKPGLLAEPASRRAVMYQSLFDARELDKFDVLRYAGTYLPEGYTAYLFETGKCYGDSGKEYITHGGCTIEEAIVPFVRIGAYHG